VPGPGNRIAQLASASFLDGGAAPAFYKLSAYDIHGNESGFATVMPTGTLDAGAAVPRELAFTLAGAMPARGEVAFRLALPAAAAVAVAVFDAQGREVRALARGVREAGDHNLLWDGRDGGGARVASGLYFARLTVGERTLVRRVVLAR